MKARNILYENMCVEAFLSKLPNGPSGGPQVASSILKRCTRSDMFPEIERARNNTSHKTFCPVAVENTPRGPCLVKIPHLSVFIA